MVKMSMTVVGKLSNLANQVLKKKYIQDGIDVGNHRKTQRRQQTALIAITVLNYEAVAYHHNHFRSGQSLPNAQNRQHSVAQNLHTDHGENDL